MFKGKGNILYYPGCLTSFVLKCEAENYKKILSKIGVEFIMLPDNICCGSPVFNAGYESEGIKLARKNLQLFKEHSVGKIITNCPACFKTFREYSGILPDWNIEVEFITTTILNYLKKKKMDFDTRERVTYHDPCHLGRHSGIYDEPREILRILGYEVVEMQNNRENSLCCGGGAGLKTNNPELADKIAKKRIEQAKAVRVDKIITTCPLCFAHLEENSDTKKILTSSDFRGAQNSKNFDICVEEFSHVVGDALGLSPMKTCPKEIREEEKEHGEMSN